MGQVLNERNDFLFNIQIKKTFDKGLIELFLHLLPPQRCLILNCNWLMADLFKFYQIYLVICLCAHSRDTKWNNCEQHVSVVIIFFYKSKEPCRHMIIMTTKKNLIKCRILTSKNIITCSNLIYPIEYMPQ